MNRAITLLSLALLLFGAAAIGGWFWAQGKVKAGLVNGIENSLNAGVHLDEVWLNLFSGRIEARNAKLQSLSESSVWKSVTIEKITGHFSMRELMSGNMPVQVEIDRGEILLQKPTLSQDPSGKTTLPLSDQNVKTGWPHVEIRQIKVRDMIVTGSEYPLVFNGLQAQVEKVADHSWRGTLNAPSLILLNYDFSETTFQFVSNKEWVQVESYSLQAGKGSITGNAKLFHHQSDQSTIHFDLKQVPVSTLLPTKWQVIIQGLVSGTGDYSGPVFDWRSGQSQAKLTLDQAQLQSLTLLKKLSLIPGLADMASVKLDQARSDLRYKEGTYNFTNLAVTKNQTLSWQGQLTISPDGNVEGTTMLGLPSSAVALFPPLKEKIFTTEQDGYAWTPVKLSGTAGKFEEDLSPRLVALARESGGKTLEQGKGLIDEGLKKAVEFLDKQLNK